MCNSLCILSAESKFHAGADFIEWEKERAIDYRGMETKYTGIFVQSVADFYSDAEQIWNEWMNAGRAGRGGEIVYCRIVLHEAALERFAYHNFASIIAAGMIRVISYRFE